MSDTKSLPINEDGEKGLISSILQNTAILLEHEAEITPQLFQAPRNQIIFEAVRKLVRLMPKVSEIDWQTFKSAFSKTELENIGGTDYLDEVFRFVPTAATWTHYYGLASDAYRARELHLGALQIIKIVSDPRDQRQATEAAEAVLKAIAAPTIKEPVPFKERIFETFEWIEKCATTPPESVIQFGIAALDVALRPVERGDQLVISAETSHGKSALAGQIVLCSTDKRFALFSVEMPWRAIIMRMFTSEGRIPFSNLRQGRLTKVETERLHGAMKRLSDRQIWIEDEQPVSVNTIAAKCRALKRKELDVVVIDYLQLVTPNGNAKRDTSREREVAEISRSLKSLALELDVVVIALSQLNDNGQLRESRAIGQDCDIHLRIYRGKDGASIQVRKHRNGPQCSVPVTFDGPIMRFAAPGNSTTPAPAEPWFPYAEEAST